jgi:hypothetical protein
MFRPRALAIALAAVLSGAFLSVPSATAAPDDARVSGFQRFVGLSTTADEGAEAPIAANGPIHAHGTDVVINDSTDRFEFRGGNVFIRHQTFRKSVRNHFDRITCYGTHTERGSWRTTGGTGRYDEVRGRGLYTLSVQFFGCDPRQEPDVIAVSIEAAGPLSY